MHFLLLQEFERVLNLIAENKGKYTVDLLTDGRTDCLTERTDGIPDN